MLYIPQFLSGIFPLYLTSFSLTNDVLNLTAYLKLYQACVLCPYLPQLFRFFFRFLSFRKGQFLVVVIDVGFILTDIEGHKLKTIPSSAVDIMYAVLLNDNIYFSQFKGKCFKRIQGRKT